MEIMMFIIFIITNLIIILCMQFAYTHAYKYENGMYLNVHIPSSHKEDAEVTEIVTTGKCKMKHFQIANVIISIAICFIVFINIAVFVLVYTIWMFAYIFGIIHIPNSSHRKMYALKIQNGWIIETQRKKVYIDTRVSAEAGATTVSYKWHALFLITELAAYIPYFMLGDTHYNILMISLFLCSVLISTLSLVFHAFINKSERHVYSMDSKLNLIVNNTMKKYKSIAMLLLSGLNAVAWIYVALYTGITGILPALFLITELAAYIPYFMLGDTHYNILMISLFLCSVLISTLSLVFHAFINKSERHVYSMDSKLNLIVNNTMKKYKSIAMLLLSGLNAVAWIYVALYTGITGILPASSYYVYIFIQLIAVLGFIVPIYMGLNRKKELLSANTSPIDVDDDEYWKTGYYYNPDDKHILIENRMQSGNYTFNYAKKGAWIFTGITCAITAGCIILVFVCMLPLINIQEKITLTNNNLTISAGGYTSEIDVNDITELKLLDKLPDDSFLRTNGASTDSYDIGRYEGRTLGKCSLYVFDGYSPILMIKSDDTLVFVNSKEDGEIERLYVELSQ